MKRISGEIQDLKEWTAYAADLLSVEKRDVATLKIIVVLAILVIPVGYALQAPGGVDRISTAVSGLYRGLMSPAAAPGAHPGVPTVVPYNWSAVTGVPTDAPAISPAPNATVSQDVP